MFKKYFYCLLLYVLLLPRLAVSQSETIYKGTVRIATNNAALPNVICEALDANNKVIVFFNSRNDGTFALKVKSAASSIRFRLLGYEKQEIAIEKIPDPNNIVIKMAQNSVNIPEILIKAPPITKSQDTIKYNVNSFKTQEDKYIVDLLRKLPGIRVEDNGTISYQGESINNFYIEGKDLLGSQYNIASNNLDVNAVASVEVWENNQPVKALQGMQHTDRAAINIKLNDDYKAKPFGEAELGAGGAPFIYSAKATTTLLTKKVQNISIAKTSNTLGNLITELEEKIDMSSRDTYVPMLENTIFSPQLKHIPIAKNRHLFNDTYIGSTNTLFSLSDFEEIKLNISHGRDITAQNYFLLNTFSAEPENITFTEHSDLKNNTSKTNINLQYKNNNPKKFLNNSLSFQHSGSRTTSYIKNEERVLYLINRSNPRYLQNIFQGVWKIKNGKLFQVYSTVRYLENEEHMDNIYDYPNLPETADLMNENIFSGQFLTKNGFKYSFGKDKSKFDIEAAIHYTSRKSNITIDNDMMLEDIEFKEYTRENMQNHIGNFRGNVAVKYINRSRFGRRITTLSLPLLYNKYIFPLENNEAVEETKKEVGLFLTPYISNNIKISNRLDLNTTANYDVRFNDEISLFYQPFLQSYRSIYLPDNELNISKSVTVSNRIRYNNISKLLFANLYVLYRNSQDNFVNSFYNTANWSYRTTQHVPTKAEMLNIILDASHTIASLQLDLKLSPSFNIYKSQFIQQNIFLNNYNVVAAIKADMYLKRIKNINIHYATQFNNINNRSNLADRNSINTFNQQLNIHYFPADKLTLSLKNELISLNNFNRENAQFYFVDAELMYQKKKFIYSITGFNLFDSNSFTNSYISTVNSFYQEIPLRSRRILFSVKFKY